MLPRTVLGRALMRKLKIYAGDKHPHAAQKPTAMEATDHSGAGRARAEG
jgi:large subunit ribosomal protein L13